METTNKHPKLLWKKLIRNFLVVVILSAAALIAWFYFKKNKPPVTVIPTLTASIEMVHGAPKVAYALQLANSSPHPDSATQISIDIVSADGNGYNQKFGCTALLNGPKREVFNPFEIAGSDSLSRTLLFTPTEVKPVELTAVNGSQRALLPGKYRFLVSVNLRGQREMLSMGYGFELSAQQIAGLYRKHHKKSGKAVSIRLIPIES